MFVYNLFLLLSTYFHRKFVTLLCEHILAFALNIVKILSFETKLYEFIFLVNTNQIKSRINVKFSINLTALYFKMSVHVIHEMFFPQNFVPEN